MPLCFSIFLGVTFFSLPYYNDSVEFIDRAAVAAERRFMELILINSSKLKIMLDKSDMKEYNIGDDSDCAGAQTRRAIRTILDRARDQIGFNTEGEEIFVQLYSSKSGGCELFVTKSHLSDTVSSAYEQSDSVQGEKKNRRREGAQKSEDCHSLTLRGDSLPSSKKQSSRMYFSFTSFEDICKVCRVLRKKMLALESCAFSDNSGRYFLLLTTPNMAAYTRLDKLTFILEYGEREKADSTSTYLAEHGRILVKDGAVELLGMF